MLKFSILLCLLSLAFGKPRSAEDDGGSFEKYIEAYKAFNMFSEKPKEKEMKEEAEIKKKIEDFRTFSDFKKLSDKVAEMKGETMTFEQEKESFEMYIKYKIFSGKMKEYKKREEVEKKKEAMKKFMEEFAKKMSGEDRGDGEDKEMLEKFHKFIAQVMEKKEAERMEEQNDDELRQDTEGMDFEQKAMAYKMFSEIKERVKKMKEEKEQEAFLEIKKAYEMFCKFAQFVEMEKKAKAKGGETEERETGNETMAQYEKFEKFVKLIKAMKAKGMEGAEDKEFEKKTEGMDFAKKVKAYTLYVAFKQLALKMREEKQREVFMEMKKTYERFLGYMKFVKMVKMQNSGEQMGDDEKDEMEEKKAMLMKFLKLVETMKAKKALEEREKTQDMDFENDTRELSYEQKAKAYKMYLAVKEFAKKMKAAKAEEEMKQQIKVYMKFAKFVKVVNVMKQMKNQMQGGEGMDDKDNEEKAMALEKFKKYQEFMKYAEMKKEGKDGEENEMYAMWKKKMEVLQGMEKQRQMMEFMKDFEKKKQEVAFKMTHQFTQLCQCAEVSDQLSMMMDQNANDTSVNVTDVMNGMGNMNETTGLSETEALQMAKKLKSMTREQQVKVFMAGLIKSVCGGAKVFVKQAKRFQATYLSNMEDYGTTTRPAFFTP